MITNGKLRRPFVVLLTHQKSVYRLKCTPFTWPNLPCHQSYINCQDTFMSYFQMPPWLPPARINCLYHEVPWALRETFVLEFTIGVNDIKGVLLATFTKIDALKYQMFLVKKPNWKIRHLIESNLLFSVFLLLQLFTVTVNAIFELNNISAVTLL